MLRTQQLRPLNRVAFFLGNLVGAVVYAGLGDKDQAFHTRQEANQLIARVQPVAACSQELKRTFGIRC